LAYPEDSAGRLLVKEVVTVPEFWTVGQIIDYLRATPEIPKDFYQIFVVDPKFTPVGGLRLSRVMCSERSVSVKDIMEDNIKPVRADMDQEEVAYLFRQYGLVSTPVVSEEGRMIGAISVDDVVDIMEEEAEEDILHLGGVGETDLFSGLSRTVAHRFPWLMINLVTAVIASVVIGQFEGSIEKLAALAVLMPIVASMGGNAGTQTLTVAVRAIATKELTSANAIRVIGKEIAVGSLNGIVFAVIAGVITYLWYGQLGLSLIFAAATIITLTLAGFVGALIPLGLVRVGVDPAIASSVVLTTVTDVVAFGLFLGLAAWWIV
jgi:magnesium transporter